MVPEGWEIRKIGELVERVRKPVSVEKDTIYQQIGIRSHAKGLFYKEPVTGEQLGNKKVFWVEPDCFILNIVFAWERAVPATSTNETGMIASHRFPMFKPDENRLCLEYLTRYFHTPQGQDALSLVSPGGAGRNKTLDQTAFLKLSIPVPPLKEQKKIGEILSSVDESIASTQAVIDQTRKVKQGLLQQLLTRGIGHEKFKETAIGLIPESWEVRNLGYFLSKESIKNGLYKPSENYGKGTPILRIDDFSNGDKLSQSPPNRVSISEEEVKAYRIDKKDILINRVNSITHLGKSALVVAINEPTVFESNMMCVRLPVESGLLPEFLRLLLMSDLGREQIQASAKLAIAQASINQQDVYSFKFAIPPIGEQMQLVERLASLEAEVTSVLEELLSLETLKQGLMQDLLTGRVRVAI